MSVRTYNPSVRVGNWNEDIQLEEDALKDFLAKKERGELLSQRTSNLKSASLSKIDLSIARQGHVQFGQSMLLVNPGNRTRGPSALSVQITNSALYGAPGTAEPCGVTASHNMEPSARNVFTVVSCDGTPEHRPLAYGQEFYLKTVSGDLFLESDRATFKQCAKKSRHNEIRLVPVPSHLSKWKVISFDPQYRLEMERTPVQANNKMILAHAKTNQDLCLEAGFTMNTAFGREYEVSGCTQLDSHKAEEDVNHWMMQMSVPGDHTMCVTPPKEDAQR